MESFIRLFGSVTIEWVVIAIAAIIFLVKVYKKIENYFTEKAIAVKEKERQMQEVMNQVNLYPKWHQQSLDIQKQFTRAIEGLQEGQKENNLRLEKMEKESKQRELNKLRDRILQSYGYYTNPKKNPVGAMSEMESEAFRKLFEDYENLGGNGFVHTVVQPAMDSLAVIPMHETEKIAELMHSRR